ncbi:hypothetical protein ACIBG7_43030 [Nonomuraea sp. NPDC050328]|uniref:hypothetical protein n=1 Tax=Nonomuraea sp. NPDC050328 TaxID=3364361 RepID=UPI0037B4D57A
MKPGHTAEVLALQKQLPDGSVLVERWSICSCIGADLRGQLGPADAEALATAEQAAVAAAAYEQFPMLRVERT